ncbi:MAG: tetratricopeptide repeat protein [Spirochaetaceae bacterium]|nr:tetratricopeptide repeat protein [Spirochaetaceae bacterium]
MKSLYQIAIEDLTKSIRLDSKNKVAYYLRGVAYEYVAEFDKAIADFSKYIAIDPNDAYAYYQRAFLYVMKDNKKKAIADCKKSLSIAPGNKQAQELLAKLQEPPPPKPPKDPIDWSKYIDPLLPTFDADFLFGFGIGTGLDLNSCIILGFLNWGIPLLWEVSFGIDFSVLRVELGLMVPYNKYLLFPIGIGMGTMTSSLKTESYTDKHSDFTVGFTFSAGVMLKIKYAFIIARYTIGKFEIDNNFEFIIGLGI